MCTTDSRQLEGAKLERADCVGVLNNQRNINKTSLDQTQKSKIANKSIPQYFYEASILLRLQYFKNRCQKLYF